MERFQRKDIAAHYRENRPSPPPEVQRAIIDYLTEKISPPFHHAVDVGCGSGQSTRMLSGDFDHVTGVDVSEAQIREGNRADDKPPNVIYRLGTDSSIPCDAGSADLVTACMAIHWFNIDKFYQEVDRILRPGGCLAVINYNKPKLFYQGKYAETATNAFTDVFELFVSGNYCDKRQSLVFNGLKGLPVPYPENKVIDDLHLDRATNIRGVIGRLLSSSTYQLYAAAHPEDSEFLARTQAKLIDCLGNPAEGELTPVLMQYQVQVVLSRKPSE